MTASCLLDRAQWRPFWLYDSCCLRKKTALVIFRKKQKQKTIKANLSSGSPERDNSHPLAIEKAVFLGAHSQPSLI